MSKNSVFAVWLPSTGALGRRTYCQTTNSLLSIDGSLTFHELHQSFSDLAPTPKPNSTSSATSPWRPVPMALSLLITGPKEARELLVSRISHSCEESSLGSSVAYLDQWTMRPLTHNLA